MVYDSWTWEAHDEILFFVQSLEWGLMNVQRIVSSMQSNMIGTTIVT